MLRCSASAADVVVLVVHFSFFSNIFLFSFSCVRVGEKLGRVIHVLSLFCFLSCLCLMYILLCRYFICVTKCFMLGPFWVLTRQVVMIMRIFWRSSWGRADLFLATLWWTEPFDGFVQYVWDNSGVSLGSVFILWGFCIISALWSIIEAMHGAWGWNCGVNLCG